LRLVGECRNHAVGAPRGDTLLAAPPHGKRLFGTLVDVSYDELVQWLVEQLGSHVQMVVRTRSAGSMEAAICRPASERTGASRQPRG